MNNELPEIEPNGMAEVINFVMLFDERVSEAFEIVEGFADTSYDAVTQEQWTIIRTIAQTISGSKPAIFNIIEDMKDFISTEEGYRIMEHVNQFGQKQDEKKDGEGS